MVKTSLLRKVEGLELWSIVSGPAQLFAVRTSEGRFRVVQSIERAEAYLAHKLHHARLARAH